MNPATAIERLDRMRTKHRVGKDAKLGLMGFGLKASAADVPNRDLVFLATTDDVDLAGEVVVPSGADMAYYLANRALFVDHRYDSQYHIGTLRYIRPYPSAKSFRAWENRSRIYAGLQNPLADDIWTIAVTAGIGCSIGFEMLSGSPPIDTDPPAYHKAQWIIRQWRMIELSVTAMPCNVAARSMGVVDGDESKVAALDALVSKGRGKGGIALETAVALGLPHKTTVAASEPKRLKRLVYVEG